MVEIKQFIRKRPCGINSRPINGTCSIFIKNVCANLTLGRSVRNWAVLFGNG